MGTLLVNSITGNGEDSVLEVNTFYLIKHNYQTGHLNEPISCRENYDKAS